MAITVLNNISDLVAENAVSSTQSSLQKTLQQLSTGLKINTGSDDAAGLAIVDGINANIAALTQSVQNSNNGVGLLQTADGALSQVTSLLYRAVTIATEGATGGINSNQYGALNTEFQSILSEINQIGTATNYNGNNVFTSNGVTSYSTTGGTAAVPLTTSTALATGDTVTVTDSTKNESFTFTATSGATIASIISGISGALAATVGTTGGSLTGSAITGSVTGGQLVITAGGTTPDSITVTSSSAALGTTVAASNNHTTVYVGDGTTTAGIGTNITTGIPALSASILSLAGNSLNDVTTSQAALGVINSAINTIANERGNIGASVNRLNAVTNVIASQITNLQSAANGLQNADIGTTVANLTQYNVLQSTGIAALQQANQAQQNVLKLVQ